MAKTGSGQDILAGLLGATRAASSLGAQKTAARGEQNQALQEALRNLMMQKQQKTQEEQFAERQALDEAQLAQAKRQFELSQGAERQKIIEGYRTEGMLLYQQQNPGAPLEDAMIYGNTVYAPAKISGKTPQAPPMAAPEQTFDVSGENALSKFFNKNVMGLPSASQQVYGHPEELPKGAQVLAGLLSPVGVPLAIGSKLLGGARTVPIKAPEGLIPANRQAEVNPIIEEVARGGDVKEAKKAILAMRGSGQQWMEQKVQIADFLDQVAEKRKNPNSPEPKARQPGSKITDSLLNTAPKGSVLGQATRPASSKIPMPFSVPTLTPNAGNAAMTQRLMSLKQNYSPEADRALDVEVKRALANKELTPEEYRQISGAMADARLINTIILSP